MKTKTIFKALALAMLMPANYHINPQPKEETNYMLVRACFDF